MQYFISLANAFKDFLEYLKNLVDSAFKLS